MRHLSVVVFYGEVYAMFGTLFIVATPIGHLEDLTFRAARVLKEVDAIACEDTRVTAKLLMSLGVSKSLLSFHAHSRAREQEKILARLRTGESVAYVSDAGTPNMNDPGGELVERAASEGMTIVPIPGPSALTAAISVCGFPMEHFTYVGFIPHKKGRETIFREMAARATPTIFLESTHRILKTLDALVAHLDPSRLLFCGRELTKMHETLYRGTASEVRDRILATSTKGEFVLIIGPANKF